MAVSPGGRQHRAAITSHHTWSGHDMTRYDRTPIIPPASGFPRRPARRARRRIPQATIPIHDPPPRHPMSWRGSWPRARPSLARTRRGQLLKARGGSISLATKATATPPLALLLLPPGRRRPPPIPDGRREAGGRDDGGRRRAAVTRNGRRTHGFRARRWILRPETRPRLGAACARRVRVRACVYIHTYSSR